MKILILFLGVLFNQSVLSGTGGGLIQQLLVHAPGGNGSGVIIFKTQINANKATCSTSDSGTQWAFSLEKEYGRAMYSLLLSAHAQKKPIGIVGANDCAAWGDRERPAYIYMNN